MYKSFIYILLITSCIFSQQGGGGVRKIVAGSNVTLSPTSGVGNVTISASVTGGGADSTIFATRYYVITTYASISALTSKVNYSDTTTTIANQWRLGAYQPKGSYLTTSDSSNFNSKTLTTAQLAYKLNYSDTTNTVANQWRLGAYQAKGTYLVPSDSTSIRTYSTALYQPKGTYLTVSDTTSLLASKTFVSNQYLAKGTGLTTADTTSLLVSKNFATNQLQVKIPNISDTSTYVQVQDTGAVVAGRSWVTNQFLAKGSGLSVSDTTSLLASKSFVANQYIAKGGALTTADTATLLVSKTFATNQLAPKAGSTAITTLGTVAGGTWNGTSIDTAYTNAVSKITAGVAITATKQAKDYVVKSDTTLLVNKTAGNVVGGSLRFTERILIDSTLRPGARVYGTATFSTTLRRLAVSVPGSTTASVYILTPKTATDVVPVAGDLCGYNAKTDSLIILRPASGTSGLTVSWWRLN